METDIRELETAIRDKRNPLKLAHSRLENRTARPNIELCRDQVKQKLKREDNDDVENNSNDSSDYNRNNDKNNTNDNNNNNNSIYLKQQ